MLRRTFVSLAAAALTCASVNASAQTAWPSQPIRIVVPFVPGGPVDTMARLVGEQMARSMGATVVVENRPGAGGNIGSAYVAKAPPDGHTLLLATGSILAINEALYPKLPFNPAKDLVPVSLTGDMPLIVAVHPDVPARSFQELVEHGRKTNGLTLSSPGNGTTPHLAAEMFKRETGVSVVHVPYKGGAESASAILGGQVNGGIESPPAVLPHIQAGKMRALAVAGPQRMATLPNVPTTAEIGLPRLRIVSWFGLAAPAGTPDPIVQRLSEEVAKAIRTPEVQERYAKLAIRPVSSTPAEMAKLAQEERVVWGKLVKDAGIRLE